VVAFRPSPHEQGVTLDYADATDFRRQHYAFLVSEGEFDAALVRIKAAGVAFYADFNRAGRGQINRLCGGRGLYFEDPDGHLLEIIRDPMGRPPKGGPKAALLRPESPASRSRKTFFAIPYA
jgi:catechol 2,3-dioxygenase-like lactoylglutathione lyase family enzyme